MATLAYVVLKHQQKKDGTIEVKIRLSHKGQSRYLKTNIFVVKQMLNKASDLKDIETLIAVNDILQEYRRILNKNATTLKYMSVDDVLSLLSPEDEDGIDFFKFSKGVIADLFKANRRGTAENLQTVLFSLQDFVKKDKLYTGRINVRFLNEYERFLRSERVVTRQMGAFTTEIKCKPLSDVSVKDYIGRMRRLFNNARKAYNNHDTGQLVIPHYPFDKFEMPVPQQSRKRNIKIADIRTIRDTPDLWHTGTHGITRANLGRDVFMLSFYLVGMNLVDLYYIDDYRDGRLSYNRKKTSGRRKDKAFISIKVEPVALPLIEKYRSKKGDVVFCFSELYASADAFVYAVNQGLKRIAEYNSMDINLTSYVARHSWATIARTVCKIDKYDIHQALNHSSSDMKITDIYIEDDFSAIDSANLKVITALNE